jgi:N-carbamoylputrescine amidase
MRFTVCELPHEPALLETAWRDLCAHTGQQEPDLILLPEFAFVEPLWELEHFNAVDWERGIEVFESWLPRLGELRAKHVVGTRPATIRKRYFNQGYLWTRNKGVTPLRRKYLLPDQPGGRESRWFARGDAEFPRYKAGDLSFGLNVCTELWALETYAAYAAMGIDAVLCPRATATATTVKWLSAGTVAAVRTGAFCLSSNRVNADGSCGGRGWIIDPDGEVLAATSRDAPFCTREVDISAARAASKTYPRYLFATRPRRASGVSGLSVAR